MASLGYTSVNSRQLPHGQSIMQPNKFDLQQIWPTDWPVGLKTVNLLSDINQKAPKLGNSKEIVSATSINKFSVSSRLLTVCYEEKSKK